MCSAVPDELSLMDSRMDSRSTSANPMTLTLCRAHLAQSVADMWPSDSAG